MTRDKSLSAAPKSEITLLDVLSLRKNANEVPAAKEHKTQ
jgi:hypothetical protein